MSVCRLTLHWLALLGIGKNWYNMMPFCLYFLLDSFFKNLNVILIFKPKVAYCCNYITRIMCLFSGAQIWFRNCFSFILPYSLHLMATYFKWSLARAQESWWVSIEVIHDLIKCRQVDYDFYNVAVSPAYGMDLHASLS